MERFPWSLLGVAMTLAFFAASFVLTGAAFGEGILPRLRLLVRLTGLPI
jgi:hypothetical protein